MKHVRETIKTPETMLQQGLALQESKDKMGNRHVRGNILVWGNRQFVTSSAYVPTKRRLYAD